MPSVNIHTKHTATHDLPVNLAGPGAAGSLVAVRWGDSASVLFTFCGHGRYPGRAGCSSVA